MPTKQNPFNFESSYLNLPSTFFSLSQPEKLINPKLIYLNEELMLKLSITKDLEQLTNILSGDTLNYHFKTYSQAYAGHQFGHFNKLGDGRAIMLGEHLSKTNQRFDIQLKGSGRTLYSRGGDGKATINSMLREYLISEAMFHLNIPTSRSLAIYKSNELIYRDKIFERGILTRVMNGHLRVGTFQFAAFYGKKEDLIALLDYAVNRHFPEIIGSNSLALTFLKEVMLSQIKLVINWYRVGFIHGVMNTDNTSITGETFDYGPCAFINEYNPATVFSSIDVNGRYSFGNQFKILKWNLIKLAEALLTLIDTDTNKSIELAQELINTFDSLWEINFYQMMSNKIGLKTNSKENNKAIVDELLRLMLENKLDYTNTFNALYFNLKQTEFPIKVTNGLEDWKNLWTSKIQSQENGTKYALENMQQNNPVVIPRNHLVEEAILNASNNNYLLFNQSLEVYKNPYLYQANNTEYLYPPNKNFEENYKTYCGT